MTQEYFSSLVWETGIDKIHLNHKDGDNIALSDLLLVIYNTPNGYEGRLAYLAKHLDDPIEGQYTYWACPEDWLEVSQNNDPVVAYAKVNEDEVVFDDTLTVHFLYEGKNAVMPKPYSIDLNYMEEFLYVMRKIGITPTRMEGGYTSSLLEGNGDPVLNLFTSYWANVAWAVFLETKALQLD